MSKISDDLETSLAATSKRIYSIFQDMRIGIENDELTPLNVEGMLDDIGVEIVQAKRKVSESV